MKKLSLLSLLSLFAFHFAHAFSEAESFVPEAALPVVPQSRFLQLAPTTVPRALLYESSLTTIGSAYLSFLKTKATDSFAELDKNQQQDCERRYDTILNDEKIDIRIAFGYFDWSTGGPAVDDLPCPRS